jgi:hypothetical protein
VVNKWEEWMGACLWCNGPNGPFDEEKISEFSEIPHPACKENVGGAWGVTITKQLYLCGWCGGYLMKTSKNLSAALGGKVMNEGIKFVGWNLDNVT